jgi:hypothetical protein
MTRTLTTLLLLLAGLTLARAQDAPAGPLYFVANTRPPDAYLSLRTDPTTRAGFSIASMPNGTLLQVFEQRPDGWWHVRIVPTGQVGWALSGAGGRMWIECCASPPAATAAPAEPDLLGFRSPSGNIFCLYSAGTPGEEGASMRCDLKENALSAPRPADCDLSWGNAFEIAADGAAGHLVCHGDTTMIQSLPILGYGGFWRQGAISCKSETIGVTCANVLGHGFSVSRSAQRVF